jgi:RNA polymerase sigma-70 factor, ECF subfamily
MDDLHQLIEAAIPKLRRYAQVLLRDKESADDLVQETLLRGLDKLHLYRSGTDLRAWLFTLMHNQYVNDVRRSARQGEKVAVEQVLLVSPASQIANLELRDLESAIDRLPDQRRRTLLLIALDGMTYDEVARLCGVPMGTVRSRLSRAREELHQMTGSRDPSSAALGQTASPSPRPVRRRPFSGTGFSARTRREVAVRTSSI